jgi:hypothetical protein
VWTKKEESQFLVFYRKVLHTISDPKIVNGVYRSRYNLELNREFNREPCIGPCGWSEQR